MEDLLEKGMAIHSSILAWRISCHLDATSIKALLKRHHLLVSPSLLLPVILWKVPPASQQLMDNLSPALAVEHLSQDRIVRSDRQAGNLDDSICQPWDPGGLALGSSQLP